MKARDIMTPDPRCVLRGDTIATAARFMEHLNCGGLPVVKSQETMELLGMITDRDITIRCTAHGHDPTECLVEDHLTRNPHSLRPDASVDEIADLMSRAQIRRVPIVHGRDRKVVGIVALADLVIRAGRPDVCEKVVERVSQPAPVTIPE